ncbi:MAG: tRNA (adenosine(37)-N6)-threonylcarbamoyltransferase complex ATPase subunit type 1 TsaE [Bacteroidaceae bacterium]|nr:tRNA (adenosine(37)-N6)-threonylcarbamoyltransferase complex ATPase subunit type 1 TsaE [Bacteroidaceae bacterium]MBQ3130161.1 tRNA (adenosine(37)-N6)-threonylcarbamoyltransferase complex ATPase subunit type 1 TsaE [Bacteroidaceae bacterium]MBQ8273239.1 tRNA (adenosine(37)-N6)-threonylcarbamoyltransferase complex ATPase subunit type 1 TsaE [Bacteroidaceae bacterium]MBR3982655.1 tRNA (adenosine(37)-N6)-threonylcarbamoyltransferase complex ATPase subunit type 1 TsaE [Bacteroidaceae bacterium]M
MTEILIPSLDKIADAAQEFVAQMGHRRVFAFYGGMGAGKTTFIKALCQQLGVKDAVTSPTFAIVNEYGSDIGPIYHFDFYRIKNLAEVMDLGFDDYAYSGHLCLMEWPELIEDLLPDNTVSVHIEETDNGMRKVTVG